MHDNEPTVTNPSEAPRSKSAFRVFLSWALWPMLFGLCVAGMAAGSQFISPFLAFNITYFFLILSLFTLERVMPHEDSWRRDDGQLIPDLAHTIFTKGMVQGVLVFGGIIGLSDYISSLNDTAPTTWPLTVWPRDWPFWGQVILGLILAEFMLYWAHRIAHEWKPLWRFHAVHHSVVKLWFVNTGRFHFIDSLISVGLGSAIVLVIGAPMEIIIWISAITAYIGMLTHCNVAMRFGPISYVFNTPGLHRWHHSKKLPEGNSNYGENLVLWDLIFGTFHNPDKRPPREIGIKEYMPDTFIDQLIYPFRYGKYRDIGISKGHMPPPDDDKTTEKRDTGLRRFYHRKTR